jgi:hypothetical protein
MPVPAWSFALGRPRCPNSLVRRHRGDSVPCQQQPRGLLESWTHFSENRMSSHDVPRCCESTPTGALQGVEDFGKSLAGKTCQRAKELDRQ